MHVLTFRCLLSILFLFAELLLFAMAALHCGITEGINFIMGNCNDTISLPCTATIRTQNYRYVMWYKTDVSYLYILTDWPYLLDIIVMVVQCICYFSLCKGFWKWKRKVHDGKQANKAFPLHPLHLSGIPFLIWPVRSVQPEKTTPQKQNPQIKPLLSFLESSHHQEEKNWICIL